MRLQRLLPIFILFIATGLQSSYSQQSVLMKAFEERIESLPYQIQIDTLLSTSLLPVSDSLPGAIVLAKRALEISLKNHYIIGSAISYQYLGNAQFLEDQFDRALINLEAGIKIYDSLKDTKGVMNCQKSMGSVYMKMGNYDEAIKRYLIAMKIAEQLLGKDTTAEIYGHIGTALNYQRKYDQAISYLETALSKNPPLSIKHKILNSLGISIKHTGDFKKAEEYYLESARICVETQTDMCEVYAYNSLVSLYREIDQPKAIQYAHKIIDQLENVKRNKEILVSVYNNLGAIYMDQLKYDQTIFYLKKALALSKETHQGNRYIIHANLSFAYEDTKQYKLALEHITTYWQFKDSLLSVEKSKLVEEYLTKFQVEKKEKEIMLLKKDKELQEAKLANNKAELHKQALIRNTSIASSILIITVMFVMFVFYRQKTKDKELLAQQAKEVAKQKKLELIRTHEIKTIQASIEGQEHERQRIAKELHDGIAGSLASIKLSLSQLTDKYGASKPLKKIITNLNDTYEEVRTISHHLTPPRITNTSFIELIDNYLKELSALCKIHIGTHYYPKDKIDQLPEHIKSEIYRILQELITNIIKHSQAKHIEINFTITDGRLSLLVEDNGVGFNTQTTTTGIGLRNIVSRVELLHGEIDIDSYLGRGTILNIAIPISG
ncbi:tetratricopeptide repeat-containing sensor histidine kinase [Reichenbachiella agariperforans]|nr:tetratricopeptide repeat protein [Reichenbachiella agariperforans]